MDIGWAVSQQVNGTHETIPNKLYRVEVRREDIGEAPVSPMLLTTNYMEARRLFHAIIRYLQLPAMVKLISPDNNALNETGETLFGQDQAEAFESRCGE